MVVQYLERLVPCVMSYSKDGASQPIDNIDILEVTPETTSRIAHHAGEDGTVYADTRIVMPARYRAVIAFAETSGLPMTAAQNNLLDASFSPMQKYSVSSYYSRCWDMAVVSSRNRDTPDMVGLRIQEVVFEECLKYGNNDLDLDQYGDCVDSKTQVSAVQMIA